MYRGVLGTTTAELWPAVEILSNEALGLEPNQGPTVYTHSFTVRVHDTRIPKAKP